MGTEVQDADAAVQQLRIGDLVVDLVQLRVSRDGEVIALPRLSFDLLLALARAAPRVLTFDEIMSTVWPGLVVGLDTISQRVKLLRDALGDDPRQPRYVAGVRGRGYQCIAPVVRVRFDGAAPVVIEVPPAGIPASPSAEPRSESPGVADGGTRVGPAPVDVGRRTTWVRAAVLVSAAAIIAALLLVRQPRSPPVAPVATHGPIPIAVVPFESVAASSAGGDAAATREARVAAAGLAEALLHQLTNVSALAVTARTSAFAAGGRARDVREIGRDLGVAYVLGGSVQSAGDRLRITAELADATTGRQLWSLRFDRSPSDLFVVQDEIARGVAKALELTIDPAGRARMAGQGTSNVEAWLHFVEGTEALATWRADAAESAVAQFAEAVRLDPKFPRGYVLLARARVRVAEADVSADRQQRYRATIAGAMSLVERALALDPSLGAAWIERARLRADEDPAAAERDYRRGLELTPSDPRAYEGLATILWQDRGRRHEALALLERARALDPLDPELAVLRAVFLYYGFGRGAEAAAILRGALERNPQYLPALARLGEILAIGMSDTAEGIACLEAAHRLDPRADWVRRLLVASYLLVGEGAAARRLAAEPGATAVDRLLVALDDRDYATASRLARDADDLGLVSGADQWAAVLAIRLEAGRTRRFQDARERIEPLVGVRWTAQGQPLLGAQDGLWHDTAGLTDLLARAGDSSHAAALGRAVGEAMDRETGDLGSVNRWHAAARVVLAARFASTDATLEALEGYCGMTPFCWYLLVHEPALDAVRPTERYRSLAARVEAIRSAQRAKLAATRVQVSSATLQSTITKP